MVHLWNQKASEYFRLQKTVSKWMHIPFGVVFGHLSFLNMGKSGERRRFDAAHELAHLVLHRHAAPNGVEAEKEAHAFAGCFLMPTASMKTIGRVVPTIDYILQLKKKWAVSAAAMTTRLHELGFLTYYHYNRLYVELSRKGFRTNEPFGVKPETSQIWQKVFAELRKEGHGVQFLAETLLLPSDEIARLVFGLVTVGFPTTNRPRGLSARIANLRVIK